MPTLYENCTRSREHAINQNLAWLGSVREVSHPLDHNRPIWVRDCFKTSGPVLPQPTIPYPERHPYCELTLNMQGRRTLYIGSDKYNLEPGAIMLLPPGIPHIAESHEYPFRSITVYILPIFFVEMGPNGDGLAILKRFTDVQSLNDRVIAPPHSLFTLARRIAQKMLDEFRSNTFGRELRLRSLLSELLVALMRWEEEEGRGRQSEFAAPSWSQIQLALEYIHTRYSEVIYVKDVAQAVHLGERKLNELFRTLLGMRCIQYLNAYRISMATALMGRSESSISTAAFSVGFETLSHFNTTFRSVIGMSPTEYIKKRPF